jgi:hypothetical protein
MVSLWDLYATANSDSPVWVCACLRACVRVGACVCACVCARARARVFVQVSMIGPVREKRPTV